MKDKRSLVVTLALSVLVVATAGAYLGLGARPNLGLDLQGGISAIYSPELQEGEERPEDFDAVIAETIEVIRSRVDSLGVAEPDIASQGDDIVVQLPGIDDDARVREVIGTTAQLSFRPVEAVLTPGSEGYEQGPDCDAPVDEREQLAPDESGVVCAAGDDEEDGESGDDADDAEDEGDASGEDGDADEGEGDEGEGDEGDDGDQGADEGPTKYEVGPEALSGDAITDASTQLGQGGSYSVGVDFDEQGGEDFATITGELACERDQGQLGLLAIVLDGAVESAPQMSLPGPGGAGVVCDVGIEGGQASITVGGGGEPGATGDDGSEAEADELALVLRTGSLPITLEPSTFETVSPTLGEDSLRSGLLAGVLGLALVAAWLIGFYRWMGAVIGLALGVFGVLVTAVIAAAGQFGFALTLAGIAGIIVSIGITADSSVLFAEGLREQVRLGKTVRTGVRLAYRRAFRTNLTGNTVTLAAAVILYFLAVGPVRGFALTLGLSAVLDIIILAVFTRPLVFLLSTTDLFRRDRLRLGDAPRPTSRLRPSARSGGTR